MQDWQLQDAKNRFSEVVKRARDDGPQTVTVHGQRAAVVVSAREFDTLSNPPVSFVDFLLGDAPEHDKWPDDVVQAINDRGNDAGRDIDF
ncbi:type II toxin-antitoxin system Phd/YefM family antitoxin [Rhodopila sp.]|uniref:type II toxin-antitoxin system Phd/YefM family antitoxin n=1 Tax=Rhodopila sp. TaxID=2480087 RepID=UPI003D09D6B0